MVAKVGLLKLYWVHGVSIEGLERSGVDNWI